MILLEFFFFLTRALKTPWWTGLVLCALFRACSDYFFHTSTPSPFCFIIPHSPRRGQQKRHPAMAGVLGIVGYFRETFSAAHVRYPLDEHERLGCRLGRPLGQVPAAPSHGLCRSAGKLPSQSRRSRASVSAAASVGRWATSHRDVAAPKGEPSRQLTRGLQKAKSRLPLWGRCPRRGRRGLRAATFLVRRRPGKTLRCFPSFLSCAARHKGKAVGLCPFSPAGSVGAERCPPGTSAPQPFEKG